LQNGEIGAYCGNVEISAVTEIYIASPDFYFVSEGQITQPLTLTDGQVVTEGNASLLFNVELDNGCCDILLPLKEKERLSSEVHFF
jgi:hypothetical protein